MSPAPRNVMGQSDVFLNRPHVAPDEESATDPDVRELNGRPTEDHEQKVVLEARRAERAAAADGILGGLIRTPKL